MNTNFNIANNSTALKKSKKKNSEGIKLFLMALPFVIFIFIFCYVPLFGWTYAFFDYIPGISIWKSSFVGIKNFTMMFQEWDTFSVVLRNTLVLSLLGLLTSPLPVAFAILLSEAKNKFFRKIVQTTTTLPNFISWIIVFGIFFSIFSLQGMLNELLKNIHIIKEPVNFLGNPDIAWFLQISLGIWKSLGWSAIIYMAAITSIDQELYDAAKVDGSGRWGCIRHVTIPGISSTFLVLFLLSVSSILSNGFDQYFVFNNALVNDKLNVLDLYVYNIGILNSQYSYSVAIGIWKTFIGIGLLMGANRISKIIRGNSIF